MNLKEQKMKWILLGITAIVTVAVVIMAVVFSDNGDKNSDVPSNDGIVTEKVDKKQEKEEVKEEPGKETKEEAKEETKKETATEPVKESEKKDTAKNTETQSSTTAVEEEKTFTPLFMYFVTKSDKNYDEYMAVVEDLKKEYKGKVEFDIIDIDENPEAKDNFPAAGNTPLLIMNNTKNEISGFGFKCADKEQLKQYIEASF